MSKSIILTIATLLFITGVLGLKNPILPGKKNSTEVPANATSTSSSSTVIVNVTAVQTLVTKSKPPQVSLSISGNLPNGCTYNLKATETREGNTFFVELVGIRTQPSAKCTEEIQDVKFSMQLGASLPIPDIGFEPGEYKIKVNSFEKILNL